MEEINEVVALITPDIRFDRDLILAIIDLLNAYEELALVQEILKVPQNQRQPRRYRQERSDTVSWRGKRRD